MAKADLINNNVVPLLIAGIRSGSLSATLFRPGAESKGGGGANAAAEPENRAAPGPSSWVADLHPVLEALGAALIAVELTSVHFDALARSLGDFLHACDLLLDSVDSPDRHRRICGGPPASR